MSNSAQSGQYPALHNKIKATLKHYRQEEQEQKHKLSCGLCRWDFAFYTLATGLLAAFTFLYLP